MPKQHKNRSARLPAAVLFLIAATVSGQPGPAQPPRPDWRTSPYRNFGAPVRVGPAALLADEWRDPVVAQAISARLSGISVGLFEKAGWRSPFSEGDPVRVYVARKDAQGTRRLVARGVENGKLRSPSIEIDGTGLSDRAIVREAGRLYVLAVLAGYGAPETDFVTLAAARFLSSPGDAEPEEAEADRVAAAAPELALAGNADTLGRRFVEEFAREAGGPESLRVVFERAGDLRENPATALSRTYADLTGGTAENLLLRAAVRSYADLQPEPGPSRIGLADLQTGGFEAGAPEPFTLRHRTYLTGDAAAALRVEWPTMAGSAAAVVRYRDAALPVDVLWLAPGSIHTVPLSGVSRVDWLVAGSSAHGESARPFFDAVSAYPFTGLVAHATAGSEGPRIWWSTASHEQLAGWAVFREQVQPDGRISRTGPEIVPAAAAAAEPFGYAYLDPAISPGTFYRYTIWAVTAEGLLARAFSATVRTPE